MASAMAGSSIRPPADAPAPAAFRDAIALATAVALGLIAGIMALHAAGVIGASRGFLVTNASQGVVALLGAVGAARAARTDGGLPSRIRRMIGLGLATWGLASVPYLLFVATGGDLLSPPQWTQVGYLLAYPFWYRAVWLLRAPGPPEPMTRRLDRVFVEATAVVTIAICVGAVLWVRRAGLSTNLTLFLPVALDLVLITALHATLRRSRLPRHPAQTWLAAGFAMLTLTDGLTIFLLPRRVVILSALLQFGYPVAMAALGVASTHPMRVSLSRALLGRSTIAVGCAGLAAFVAVAAVAGTAYAPAALAACALLLWRLLAILGPYRPRRATGPR